MAGNVQADNSGNIYVEFDYNNIIVVDPNKTIDSLGKIKERLVDHENLVMYANLEAELLPRTKLAIGASPEDRVRIVSIAKMDFLKPTKDSFLGTGYYDELTGENTTKFKGVNQMMTGTVVPKNGDKPYVLEKPSDLNNVLDNGLLGITNISVDTNLSFIPSVRISLEDVQGRALFQLGNNSPYAAFFNLPYPPFYLTLKGYYGQAVRYQLNFEKFKPTQSEVKDAVLFVGTIDYLRRETIMDLIDYTKDNNKELWLMGEDKQNYLSAILSQEHVKHFEAGWNVEKLINQCSETAGIQLGRTTIESWLCGKPSWIYKVNSLGSIESKERVEVPTDLEKYYTTNVVNQIKEEYNKVLS